MFTVKAQLLQGGGLFSIILASCEKLTTECEPMQQIWVHDNLPERTGHTGFYHLVQKLFLDAAHFKGYFSY